MKFSSIVSQLLGRGVSRAGKYLNLNDEESDELDEQAAGISLLLASSCCDWAELVLPPPSVTFIDLFLGW